MIGTLVNTATVLVGSTLGCLFKKNFPEKYKTVFFQIIGLFTIYLGIKMTLNIQSPLAVVFCLILGTFTGEWLDLDGKSQKISDRLKKQFNLKNEKFTEGFVSGFLLFCMGSMSILGAIEEGFGKTSDLLLTKSIMDGFSSMMLASALGVGVMFSALAVFGFQGGITLLVWLIGKNIPIEFISEITGIGGIIMLGLGINLMQIKNIKVINMLPSLVFICVYVGVSLWL